MVNSFTLCGKELEYFHHPYNSTRINERRVEAAIGLELLNGAGRVIEVGNVLRHYSPHEHVVVDKYELCTKDVVDFKPDGPVDLVISISTLEHVGWDRGKDPWKILRAVENMASWGGKMVCTLPLGYNKNMDAMLESGELSFPFTAYMKRVSLDNRWEEVAWEEIRGSEYGRPFLFANGLVIGVHGGKLW